MNEFIDIGDLIELTQEFNSDVNTVYPAGSLGIVKDKIHDGNGYVIVWVHFKTGYVGALNSRHVRKV